MLLWPWNRCGWRLLNCALFTMITLTRRLSEKLRDEGRTDFFKTNYSQLLPNFLALSCPKLRSQGPRTLSPFFPALRNARPVPPYVAGTDRVHCLSCL